MVSFTLRVDSITDGTRNDARWHTSPVFLNLSGSLGFCKTDVHVFKGECGFATACRAIVLLNFSMRGAHSECTEDRSKANNIKHDEYKQIYIHHGFSCSELKPPEAFRDALKISDEEGISDVRLKPRTLTLNDEMDFGGRKSLPRHALFGL